MIVVDTNVLAYLWLPGAANRAAEELLRREPRWAAPLLWRSEFRNVLGGLVRRRRLTVDGAIRIAEAAEEQLRDHELAVPAAAVLELVAASGCTAYDCEFVALASELGVALVTEDRQVLAAFPEIARPLG